MKILKAVFVGLLLSLLTATTVKAETIKNEVGGIWERWMGECDGDYLYGTYSGIQLTHFNKNGDVDWVKSSIEAEVVSVTTGEVFKVIQHVRENFTNPRDTHHFTFTQNYIGDMGTRYIIAVTFEIDQFGNWTVVKDKAKCW